MPLLKKSSSHPYLNYLKYRLNNMKKLSGFTLLEMLIVVTITAVLSIVGFLAVVPLREKNQHRSVAVKILNQLEKARDLAIKRLDEGVFSVNFTSDSLTIDCESGCGSFTQINETLPEGFSITNLSHGNKLLFLPSTGRTAQTTANNIITGNTTFTIQSENYQTQFTIPPSGGIYFDKTVEIP